MTKKRKRGGGSKLIRSEVVTIRLDSKLRFKAELAGRMQHRTLSNFIEWAIEEALEHYCPAEGGLTAQKTGDMIWDVDPADRFIKLANYASHLLTHNEQVLWKAIREIGMTLGIPNLNMLTVPVEHPLTSGFKSILRRNWTVCEQAMTDEMSVEQILDVMQPLVAELREGNYPRIHPRPPTSSAGKDEIEAMGSETQT